MHMLHYCLQEFPIVTVHLLGRLYFAMSFFQDQVAKLANTFNSFLYVCFMVYAVVGARLCISSCTQSACAFCFCFGV